MLVEGKSKMREKEKEPYRVLRSNEVFLSGSSIRQQFRQGHGRWVLRVGVADLHLDALNRGTSGGGRWTAVDAVGAV